MKKDTRTLTQVAKSVIQMRKRVAAMVKKHERLQARIQKLADAGHIISMSKDAEVVAGENCWYVKAESLNIDPDAPANWYYQVLFIEEYGVYQCACGNVKQADCKHAIRLGNHFHEEALATAGVSTIKERAVRGTLNRENEGFSILKIA